MTNLKKSDLTKINWSDLKEVDWQCDSIKSKSQLVSFGESRRSVGGDWVGFGRRNLYRNLTKNERENPKSSFMGLPKGDYRHDKKTVYGYSQGDAVGFLLDLTPCRTKLDEDLVGKPWFHLDTRFMRLNTNRIFSGLPDSRGYCAKDENATRKLFTWYALARTFMTCGYPLWANTEELWIPNTDLEQGDFLQEYFALGFAENDCVEVEFPANNPVSSAKHLTLSNPLSPLDCNSFWSKKMSSEFKGKVNGKAKLLVDTTNRIFDAYDKKIKGRDLHVDYEKSYFIGAEKKLTTRAGLIQIKDFAIHHGEGKLLELFQSQNEAVLNLKREIDTNLRDKSKINYFGPIKKVKIALPRESKSAFDLVLDKRVSLAAKLVSELIASKEFSRVKFAKAFYLADVISEVDLKTEYVREAAGPLDQRLLYNEKIGIEYLAASRGLFEVEKKKGKEFNFVIYKKGPKINDGLSEYKKFFSKESKKIDGVIKLVSSMSRDQIEIVATLFASWNDLLLSKKKFNDQDIFKEFKDRWHPDKSKKFQRIKGKKPRFTDKQLVDALAWMKEKGLVPKGSGKKTKSKHSKNDDLIPF